MLRTYLLLIARVAAAHAATASAANVNAVTAMTVGICQTGSVTPGNASTARVQPLTPVETQEHTMQGPSRRTQRI